MKIPRGNKTEELPMKTHADFANAAKRVGMNTQVVSVESASDYSSLVRLLSSLVRPFAVSIITIK